MDLKTFFLRYLAFSYLTFITTGIWTNTLSLAHAMKPSMDNNYVRTVVVKSLAKGAKLALEQCKTQFRWERWNCPKSSFAKSFKETTREKAFVTSIAAAGIVYSVTKSCSTGDFMNCGCRNPPPKVIPVDEEVKKTWSWGGCSDDITTGDAVSAAFFTSLEGRGVDVLTQINSHNSRLGRLIVREHVAPECKCHGLSGSCTTKTCWRKISSFHSIASTIKQRYQRAQRVQVNRVTRQVSLEIPENQMVFLEESPDYCKPNNSTRWPGTGGRVCSRGRTSNDKAEKRSCRELCRSCGHQVKKRPITINWYCNCKFKWCCEVKCDTCNKTITQHYCDDTPRAY